MIVSETCTRCDQEVRLSSRGWLHRGPADHYPVLGTAAPDDVVARLTQHHLERDIVEEEEGWDEVPDPEIRALPLHRGLLEILAPLGARRFMAAAVKAGWTVRATYARGPLLHKSQGKVLRIVDSVMVKLEREDARAVATWLDGDAEVSFWITPDLACLNVTELRARLTA